MVFFAHLLNLGYSEHHQSLISSSLYYPGPLHKIAPQSVHNFVSNVVLRQTNNQTDRQTNATKNNLLFTDRQTNATKKITPFAKEDKM